jgi:hypothetical protein
VRIGSYLDPFQTKMLLACYQANNSIFIMNEVYNFLGSWQLFPEKGTYEAGQRPKSGTFKLSSYDDLKNIIIETNWLSLENEAFSTEYSLQADGAVHPFELKDLANGARFIIKDRRNLSLEFFKDEVLILTILLHSMTNGFIEIIQKGITPSGESFTNREVYHKQLSVLPYAASVAGAIIQPNRSGVIKHQALSAMEEQTNMQLTQIRQQVELLAKQAQEIHARKEMSLMIYNATLSFKPLIGSCYFLYEKKDDVYSLSMIGPKEWGSGMPYKKFIAHVKLLADHTWIEV